MTTSSTRRDLAPDRAARAAGIAAIVAVVVNLVIFGIVKVLDVDFVAVPTGDEEISAVLPAVALLTVVPLIGRTPPGGVRTPRGGRVERAGVGRSRPRCAQRRRTAGCAVETSTGVALALMHVATGVTWFLVVRLEAATP